MFEQKAIKDRKQTNEIISKISKELGTGNTRKYINYIDMSMHQEDYSIGQVLKTAGLL